MKTAAASLLNDFSSAVGDFQLAAMGAYRGPSMPITMLREAIGTVDGLNTAALVDATQAAVTSRGGSSIDYSVQGSAGSFLRDLIIDTLGGVAGGTIASLVSKQLDSFSQERSDADSIAKGVEGCARAIDSIVDTSDSFMSEVIGAVTPVIQILTAVIKRTPAGRLAALIIPIAAGLIDNTMGVLSRQCRDRDTHIDECYAEMERRCDEMLSNNPPCECPDNAPAPERPTQEGEPHPQPDAESGANTKTETSECTLPPAEPAGKPDKPAPEQAPAPVPSPGVCPEPDPATLPVADAPECARRVTQAVVDFQECAQRTHASLNNSTEANVNGSITGAINGAVNGAINNAIAGAHDVVADAQKAINSAASSCLGTLGAVGAGVAAVGLGVAAYAVADCVGLTEPDCAPEPEPAPEPAPRPEPKPEPEPAPPAEPEAVPVTDCVETDDSVIEPPPELSQVEEPAPPPKKQFPAPGPQPEPEPAPQPAPPPASPSTEVTSSTQAQSSVTAQSSVQQSWERARKAGQW